MSPLYDGHAIRPRGELTAFRNRLPRALSGRLAVSTFRSSSAHRLNGTEVQKGFAKGE